MRSVRIFLGGGLALMVAAVALMDVYDRAGSSAFALAIMGLLGMALGLMQPYVAWPAGVKNTLAAFYFFTAAALPLSFILYMFTGIHWDRIAQWGIVLILLFEGIGLLRPAKEPG